MGSVMRLGGGGGELLSAILLLMLICEETLTFGNLLVFLGQFKRAVITL